MPKATDHQIVVAIQGILNDLPEWNADTFEHIASILHDNGYHIHGDVEADEAAQ